MSRYLNTGGNSVISLSAAAVAGTSGQIYPLRFYITADENSSEFDMEDGAEMWSAGMHQVEWYSFSPAISGTGLARVKVDGSDIAVTGSTFSVGVGDTVTATIYGAFMMLAGAEASTYTLTAQEKASVLYADVGFSGNGETHNTSFDVIEDDPTSIWEGAPDIAYEAIPFDPESEVSPPESPTAPSWVFVPFKLTGSYVIPSGAEGDSFSVWADVYPYDRGTTRSELRTGYLDPVLKIEVTTAA